jgi:hypothetical protein
MRTAFYTQVTGRVVSSFRKTICLVAGFTQQPRNRPVRAQGRTAYDALSTRSFMTCQGKYKLNIN